jgi:hypothetical protein
MPAESAATPPASNTEPQLCCRLLYASLIGLLDRFCHEFFILFAHFKITHHSPDDSIIS